MITVAWLAAVGLVVSSIWVFYLFLIWNRGCWRKRGVKEAKSYPLVGSMPSIVTQKQHLVYDIDEIYSKYKSTDKFVGGFMARVPQLVIIDPGYIHKIYVTDFKHFRNNEMSTVIDEEKDPIFGRSPFSSTGEQWKIRRHEISSGLSPSRIKTSYPIIMQVCAELREYVKIEHKVAGQQGIDANEMCLRYTSEVVTNSVLGLRAGSLTANPTSILSKIKAMFNLSFSFILYFLAISIWPSIRNYYKMRMYPKQTERYFVNLMQQALEQRQRETVERADFLNYMLQLQQKKALSVLGITSHVMTFLTDGFVTTARTMAHCLLSLGRDPSAQKKLRTEIMINLDEHGNIPFERLAELPYLDACFFESLRLFPPIAFSNKICTEPYEFTNQNGQTLRLEAGERVIIPNFSLHHDERFYPQPERFQPERFLDEKGGVKKYIDQGMFLGFGNGPRQCLGMRIALIQGKAGIVEIIKNFNVKINPKTRCDNYLDKTEFIPLLDGGIWLDMEPLH